MKRIATLAGAMMLANIASAEIVDVPTQKTVPEAADALAAAIKGAGATVFARVNHGKGAQMVGEDIGGSELLIFGNPKVGTPAMLQDRRMGLALPLKVLVYEDADGAVWLSYEAPADRLGSLAGADLPPEVVGPMAGALQALTAKAAR